MSAQPLLLCCAPDLDAVNVIAAPGFRHLLEIQRPQDPTEKAKMSKTILKKTHQPETHKNQNHNMPLAMLGKVLATPASSLHARQTGKTNPTSL